MELSGVIFSTGARGSMNIDRRTNMKSVAQLVLPDSDKKILHIFDNKIKKRCQLVLSDSDKKCSEKFYIYFTAKFENVKKLPDKYV